GYAAWLGARPPSQPDAELLKEVEQLSEQAHTLALMMEPGRDEPGKPEIVDYDALARQAVEMDKAYRALQEEWKEAFGEALAKTSVASWRDGADALLVPDPTLRAQLVTNLRRISRELLVRSAGGAAPVRDEETAPGDKRATPLTPEREAQ